MSTGVIAGAGFGVKIPSDIDWSNPNFASLKEYAWDNATDNAHDYYESLDSMFDEDNFEAESFFEAFPALEYCWTGNPYSTNRKHDQIFVVAKTSLVRLGDAPEYQDLSVKSVISSEAYTQLALLSPLLAEEDKSPRWYVWSSIS